MGCSYGGTLRSMLRCHASAGNSGDPPFAAWRDKSAGNFDGSFRLAGRPASLCLIIPSHILPLPARGKQRSRRAMLDLPFEYVLVSHAEPITLEATSRPPSSA